jgi:hypothetical protein
MPHDREHLIQPDRVGRQMASLVAANSPRRFPSAPRFGGGRQRGLEHRAMPGIDQPASFWAANPDPS